MAMQGTTSFIYAQPVTYEKPYVDANGEHLIATKVRDDSLGGVYPVLTKSAQEDDLNTRLGLAPHLEFYPFPSTDQVFVSNWLHKSNLKGDIVLDILSLLASGDLNGDQLVQRLQNKYSDLEVRSILYYLIAKGYSGKCRAWADCNTSIVLGTCWANTVCGRTATGSTATAHHESDGRAVSRDNTY